jgi:hypothetical protein
MSAGLFEGVVAWLGGWTELGTWRTMTRSA